MAEITKKRASKCSKHFVGCACREYKYQQMEQALKVIHTWAAGELRIRHGCLDPVNVRDLIERVLNG